MSKKDKKPLQPVEEAVVETKVTGCDSCKNTGLEPGVSRDTAQVCPVCNGSPFETREEVK